MNADERKYPHEELTKAIIGVFFEVYNELGYASWNQFTAKRWPSLCEQGDFRCTRSSPLVLGFGARHESQLLNYLRASVLEVGLLFNFGPKPHFRRLAFSNYRKRGRSCSAS
jgi:hypothetical protein